MDLRAFSLVLLCCTAYVHCAVLKKSPRQQDGNAEVIQVTSNAAPIALAATNDPLETPVIEPRSNSSTSTSSSAQPTPVPADQPITTEQLPPNAPSLVPSVVEISTPDPNNTPPPPAAAGNSTAPAEEDDDDGSDEESDEEADEEDEEDEEEEDEEDEEEDEENEEDPSINVIGKKRKGKAVGGKVGSPMKEEIGGSFNEHKVQLGSVIVVDEDKLSEEDDGPAVPARETVKLSNKNLEKLAVGGSSALQGVPARIPTNEDDEADFSGQGGESVVLAIVKS